MFIHALLSLFTLAHIGLANTHQLSGSGAELLTKESPIITKSVENLSSLGVVQAPLSSAEATNSENIELVQASCSAYTACPYGGAISCYSHGAGCTWRVWPYARVRCEGFNNWGHWVVFDFSCY